jgi:xanthine dehydrogenase small subunit
MPPVLIALGATMTLRRGAVRRVLALEDYFIAYGRQDRAPGEFVEQVFVPRPAPGTLNAAYKVSKRRDEDSSAGACGLHVALVDGVVKAARLAYGGMAATPKRAAKAEAALVGLPWTEATVAEAGAALGSDFTPLTDWRASAEYRAMVARNLLRRFWLESAGTPLRLKRELAG